MQWLQKKFRHAGRKIHKVSGSKKTYDDVIACSSFRGTISQMEVVEDFESRPHKAVSFVVERDGGTGME